MLAGLLAVQKQWRNVIRQLVILVAVVAAHMLGHELVLVIDQKPVGEPLQDEFVGGVLAGDRITITLYFDTELAADPDAFDDRRFVGQRIQGPELFLREEFLRCFLGLAVNSDIGNCFEPIMRRGIDDLKVRQFQAVEEVLFHIGDAVFHASQLPPGREGGAASA